MRLLGRTVLVTGAARGIGRATAVRMAEEGADLVLVDIGHDLQGVPYSLGSQGQLDATAQLCRKRDVAVLAATADVRSAREVGAVVDAALDRFGAIDVLVNNAGIGAPAGRPIHEVSSQEWAIVLDVNLTGSFELIRAVVPTMLGQGRGSIINIASTAGLVGYRHFAAYVTSKHALIGLTKAAALDYAPQGIRVNAICPGPVRDDPQFSGQMTAVVAQALGITYDEQEAVYRESVPTNVLVDPADVAGAVAWLASDDSLRVTGSIVTVDSGFSAR